VSTAVNEVRTLTDITEVWRPPSLARTPSLTDWEFSEWEQSVRSQMSRLLLLRKDWDGYGARPIRRDVLVFASELLYKVMLENTPPPHITPMSHEGVMLEWHQSGIDLEIEIEAPGDVWVSYVDSILRRENEWQLKANFELLSDPIHNLTIRSASGWPS
jgi:hypothetical protein